MDIYLPVAGITSNLRLNEKTKLKKTSHLVNEKC